MNFKEAQSFRIQLFTIWKGNGIVLEIRWKY
jgi:hypothetical protein